MGNFVKLVLLCVELDLVLKLDVERLWNERFVFEVSEAYLVLVWLVVSGVEPIV
jgi:hypothetical protein